MGLGARAEESRIWPWKWESTSCNPACAVNRDPRSGGLRGRTYSPVSASTASGTTASSIASSKRTPRGVSFAPDVAVSRIE